MQKTSAKRPALGIGLRILSGALFATMAIFVKALSGHVPVGQIVFFRSAFALISLVIFLELLGVSPWIGDQTTARHMLRSAFCAAASFASIARLPLALPRMLAGAGMAAMEGRRGKAR